MKAVPFGATRAVFSFLRTEQSIWHLATSMLRIPLSVFYDDFVVFLEVGLVTSTNQAFTGLLHLLGWRYAMDGSKCCDFAPCFDALGITIDLSDSRVGLARFANTKKRCAELSECLKGILAKGRLPKKEALRRILLTLRFSAGLANCA